MSDAEIIRIARKAQRLQWQLADLIHQIQNSDHPNADELAASLYDECWFAAWPEHVIASHLEHPERWETGNWGIRHKGATRAHETRKRN